MHKSPYVEKGKLRAMAHLTPRSAAGAKPTPAMRTGIPYPAQLDAAVVPDVTEGGVGEAVD
jgi:hypothetical protein